MNPIEKKLRDKIDSLQGSTYRGEREIGNALAAIVKDTPEDENLLDVFRNAVRDMDDALMSFNRVWDEAYHAEEARLEALMQPGAAVVLTTDKYPVEYAVKGVLGIIEEKLAYEYIINVGDGKQLRVVSDDIRPATPEEIEAIQTIG